MHNVFKEIVVGFIGFVVWAVFSVIEGINMAIGKATAFGQAGMTLGFIIMVGGPVVYIVVIPVLNRLKRRRE